MVALSCMPAFPSHATEELGTLLVNFLQNHISAVHPSFPPKRISSIQLNKSFRTVPDKRRCRFVWALITHPSAALPAPISPLLFLP